MSYKEKYKDYIGKKFKYKKVNKEDHCPDLYNKIVTVISIENSVSTLYPFGVKTDDSDRITHLMLEELEPIVQKKNHLPRWF